MDTIQWSVEDIISWISISPGIKEGTELFTAKLKDI